MRRALVGKRVCKKDGGRTPGGIASPHFKHGKYSKYVPKPLEGAWERLTESDVLELRHEMKLLEARNEQLMESIDSGEAPAVLFAEIGQRMRQLQAALRSDDKRGVNIHLSALAQLAEEGERIALTWQEWKKNVGLKARLIDTEMKRRQKFELFVTVEDVSEDHRALALAVKAHVEDEDQLRAIAEEFARITQIRALPEPAAD